MTTLDHLMRRLRELYSKAILTGERVADKYLLIIVETEQTTQQLIAEARLTVIHSALQYAFVSSESIVTIPPRRALALAATTEPQLSRALARLRNQLTIAMADRRLPSTRCWRQSLPRDPVELSLTLFGMDD